MCAMVRKTYPEQLKPTPQPARQLAAVLWRCRTRDQTAREHRLTRYKQRGVSRTRSQQEAAVKDLRAAMAEDGARHRQVVPEVLAQLDQTDQAFFRRRSNGEQPGFPRFHGRTGDHCVTDTEDRNGARRDTGSLVRSTIGRLAVRWSRPSVGTIKTVTLSNEAAGWYVSWSGAEVPVEPWPRTGRETGIDGGLNGFLITADGDVVDHPRHYRTGEKGLTTSNQHVSRRKQGSHRWWKAVPPCGKQHQHVRRQRNDLPHQTALALVRQYDVIYSEAIQPANLIRRPEAKQDEHGG